MQPALLVKVTAVLPPEVFALSGALVQKLPVTPSVVVQPVVAEPPVVKDIKTLLLIGAVAVEDGSSPTNVKYIYQT